MSPTLQAYRASLLYFTNDPAFDEHATQWHSDGLLLVQDGKIQAAGDYATLAATLPPGTAIEDLRGKILCPGFIDTHIH